MGDEIGAGLGGEEGKRGMAKVGVRKSSKDKHSYHTEKGKKKRDPSERAIARDETGQKFQKNIHLIPKADWENSCNTEKKKNKAREGGRNKMVKIKRGRHREPHSNFLKPD